MESSCTMVVNMVGQLTRGITFAYELRLPQFLHIGKLSMCRITSWGQCHAGTFLTQKNVV
jgi:hypothetical protein